MCFENTADSACVGLHTRQQSPSWDPGKDPALPSGNLTPPSPAPVYEQFLVPD